VPARAAVGAGVGDDAGAAVEAALVTVLADLDGARSDLAVVFLGAAYADRAEDVRRRVADALSPRVLIGVTAQGVVSGPGEIEQDASVSVWAAHLPGAVLTPLRFAAPGGAAGAGPAPEWPDLPADAHGLVVLADPFTFPAGALLAWAAHSRPGLPVSGGIASGARRAGDVRLLLDGAVLADGAVGVAIGGDVALRHVVSQGCRPVGQPFVVTKAERNVIAELAGAPAADRIREVFDAADAEDRALLRQGLHVGLVIDEYADEHEQGDFLIRGVIGAHPETGAVAVGDVVRVGQVIRFQVRDARSADEDLRALLDDLAAAPGRAAGALLFTCNGRGERLFGVPDHDAGLLSAALGGAPVAGFFAGGELGPVGGSSFLHGFTASVLVVGADEP
jgi:small ligand-binding sensory domain FIST